MLESFPVGKSASGHHYWWVCRHEDIQHVLLHPEIFSSKPIQWHARGMALEDASPEVLAVAAESIEGLPITIEELTKARFIIAADPPRHRELREIVSRGFAPHKIKRFQDSIDAKVRECIESIDPTAPFDIGRAIAAPLPVAVIGRLLSVGDERLPWIKRWSDDTRIAAQGANGGSFEAQARVFELFREFCDYFVPMIEERREAPVEDLISDLVRAGDGDTLDVAETIMFLQVLMAAGNSTTAHTIGNTVVALMENPDQLELLLERPELLPNAIEESLRYRSPVQVGFREVLQDTEIGGTAIPKGALINILFGAANHDPRRFDEPERFLIERETRGHIAFGHGIHFCIGSALGRMEAASAITALLPLLSNMRLRHPLTLQPSFLLWGYEEIVLEPK
jgi:cytochrome P450